MLKPYQIIYRALLAATSDPEAVDLAGATDVLRDQVITHMCGTRPRQSIPLSPSAVLELACVVNAIVPESAIVRSELRRYEPPATMRPGDCPPIPDPCIMVEDGIVVWRPWL